MDGPFEGGGGGFRRRGPGDRRRFKGRREADGWASDLSRLRAPRDASTAPERDLVQAMLHERKYAAAVAERLNVGNFRDDDYRAIFAALSDVDAETPLDAILPALPPRAVQLVNLLLERPVVGNVEAVVAGALNQVELREIDDEMERAKQQFPLLEGEALADLARRMAALRRRQQELGARRPKVGRTAPTRTPREDA